MVVMSTEDGGRTHLDALERLLGHRFHERRLLETAFLHDSFLHEHPDTELDSNERLEFLGDAWLDYHVARHLFEHLPDATEGDLTKLRAAAVQTATLARAAREAGLGEHLRMGQGEARTGGKHRARNLAGLYEAVLGALLLDGGERVADGFLSRTLGPVLEAVKEGRGAPDYKSALQEFCQSRGWEQPSYSLDSAEGPDHARHFRVSVRVNGELTGHGEGSNRREAEKQAAGEALTKLEAEAR